MSAKQSHSKGLPFLVSKKWEAVHQRHLGLSCRLDLDGFIALHRYIQGA